MLHELGHYVVARRNGVHVMEFAVGMGPSSCGWVSPRTGTQYSLRLLPIGGYCAMEGEDGQTQSGPGLSFMAIPPLSRLVIILAGPLTNFLIAFLVLFAECALIGMPTVSNEIGAIEKGFPAYDLGLRPGDILVGVGNAPNQAPADITSNIHASLGRAVVITYKRGNSVRSFTATPVPCPGSPSQGCVGFELKASYTRLSLVKSANQSIEMLGSFASGSVAGLVGLVHNPQGLRQFSGPIGIARASMMVQSLGIAPYLDFVALISFALGFFNVLPIPALDGGRALFILIELIRGKPVDTTKEAWVHFGGMAFLMCLVVLLSYNDILKAIAHSSP